MSRPLLVVSPAGARRLNPADLPLRIGRGARIDIRVPGLLSDTVIGLISVLDDRPSLQKSAEEPSLAVNGEALVATRWLEDGDVVTVESVRIECHFDAAALRLLVAYTDMEYPTLPPIREPAPGPGIATTVPRRRQPVARARRSILPTAIYASLGLLVAVAAYIFTARSVGIAVTPAEASVDLRGSWLPIRLGSRFLLRPGTYEVSARAEGYQQLIAPLHVGDEARPNFSFSLRKLPGRVRIMARPEVPVQITVDGQSVAAGPSGEFLVAAGAHTFRVLARRYQAFEMRLEVTGLNQAQQLAVPLLPNWADVTFTSRPAGATIVADGEVLGSTPATVPIEAGTRQVEMRKDGFKTWRQDLAVTARQRLELPAVDLVEADAILN